MFPFLYGDLLTVAGTLAQPVRCVEYGVGDFPAAGVTRQVASNLGAESDNRGVMGWAYELAVWLALTSGDYHQDVHQGSDLRRQ